MASRKTTNKGGRPAKLTEEAQKAIVEAIGSGSFDYIAAEAAGITARSFRNWMERGEQATSGKYHDFYLAVMQARAQARKSAESRVWATDPFKWLRFGPGREKAGRPGWTDGTEEATDALASMADTVIKTVWGRADREPPPQSGQEEPAEPSPMQQEEPA